MGKNYLPLNLVGRFLLSAQLLVISSILNVGEAFVFVPNGGNVQCVSRRSFFPRSSQRLFNGFEASSSHGRRGAARNQDDGLSMKDTNKRQRKNKRPAHKRKGSSLNNGKKAQAKKINRPASFAAIRKGLQNGNDDETTVDRATIARIGKQTRRNRQKELQEKRRQDEERRDLKLRAYQLSIDSERGFRSTRQQEEEMREIVNRLVGLNPTREPAWSYYGKTNPLTRQLYQSLAIEKGKFQEETLASLEGKWILTYTNVPSIVSLASDVPFAKLGRIGQECAPFPDYTVRTIIEWKRPDWVTNLKALGGLSKWLFGKEESSVLQITTLRAKATPNDPTSWGISKVPRAFEIVSSKSSTALYDDYDEEDSKGTLSFITDDGLVAMDPLRPLKIGLQMAGRDGNKVKGYEEHKKAEKHHHDEHGAINLVNKDGLVALNPFQPWTVGLQMAGLGVIKASEPWKIAEVGKKEHHHHTNNLLDDIHERGLVEGVLKQTPIQLPTPDAVASLLGDNEPTTDNSQSDRILYLDEDIRIIGNGPHHVTIESRACTEEDEDCWF